jgi:hypothetical protein
MWLQTHGALIDTPGSRTEKRYPDFYCWELVEKVFNVSIHSPKTKRGPRPKLVDSTDFSYTSFLFGTGWL